MLAASLSYNSWFDALRSAATADSVDITLEVTGWDPSPARETNYESSIQRLQSIGLDSLVRRLGTIGIDTLRAQLWDIEQVTRVLRLRGHASDGAAILEAITKRLDGDAAAHSALARAYELDGNAASGRTEARRALALESLDTRAIELSRRLRFS